MNSKSRVLIVDDEPDIRELLEITLTRMGLDTVGAENLSEARQILSNNKLHLCLTDMRLPDGDGLTLVEFIQQSYPDLPVAVISAHGTMETAIQALKYGAFDFVSKPVDLKQLRTMVTSALGLKSTRSSMPSIQESRLKGDSPAFKSMLTKAFKLSKSQAPVFICGESGTGKELVANFIHDQGPRAKGPFIAVNCGAIPAELMESEFFGHKRGSFTGATRDKEGFFQAAKGGTLFLDEVADLPISMQVKLLRAIQEKKVRSVGDYQEQSVDVRILSATHKNLQDAVEKQLFRQDLYYRLNVIQLDIPPLRERKDDIPGLSQIFLTRLVKEYQSGDIELSAKAKQKLLDYSFPGNVRELENILERAFALSDNSVIEAEDLGIDFSPDDSGKNQLELVSENTELNHVESLSNRSGISNSDFDSLPNNICLDDHLSQIEKQIITEALESTRWNKTAAAKKLGITFRALRYKLKKLEME